MKWKFTIWTLSIDTAVTVLKAFALSQHHPSCCATYWLMAVTEGESIPVTRRGGSMNRRQDYDWSAPLRLGQKKHLAVFLSERAVFPTAGWRQILLPSCWNLSHSFPTCLVPTSKSFAYSSTLGSSTEAEVIWFDHCCSLSDLKMSQKACKRKVIGIFWKPTLKTWKKSCIIWQQVSHTCGLAFTPADSNQLKATTSPS